MGLQAVPVLCQSRGLLPAITTYLLVLLLRLLPEYVNGPAGVVLGRNVGPGSIGLADLVDFLEDVIVELKVLKVGLDSRWSNRLGDNRKALVGRPVDQDLRRLLIKLLGNVNNLGLVNDSRFSSGVVTKRRVGGDNNVLLLAIFEELGLDQAGVTLNLVHGRNNTSLLDELLQKLNVKVGNTDGLDLLGLLRDSDQLLPSVDYARSIPVNGNLSIFSLGEEVVSRSKRNGPVDKINIEVIGTELLEAGVKIGLNLLGSVRVVPELGDKEEVFSWNAGGLDTLGNLVLVFCIRGQKG